MTFGRKTTPQPVSPSCAAAQPLLPSHDGELELGLKVPMSAVWMVCVIVFFASLGGSISAPILPFYAQEFHATGTEVGLLFSTFSLAQVFALPFLGCLADHIGRRIVLIMALFGAGMGAIMQGFAPTLGWMLFARVWTGAWGAVGSTANVYVCDVTTEGTRAKYLGWLMSINGVALAFGPGLGGGLSKLGLNMPVIVDGTLCIVAGFLAFIYLPESPAWAMHQQELAVATHASEKRAETGMRSFSKSVWCVLLVELCRGFSFSAIFAVYALFAYQVYDMDSLKIGFAVCCGAITLICTNVWISPRVVDSWGEVMCACLGLFLIGAGELVLAFVPVFQISLAGMCVSYMGQAMAGCTITAVTSVLATDDNRGCVMSMQQVAQCIGKVLGPVALGILFTFDPRWPFAVAAAAVLLATVFLFALRGSFSKRASLDEPELASSPPTWEDEVYSEADVEEMGRFMCELLSKNHYRWRAPEEKEALKRMLCTSFPELSSTASTAPSAMSKMLAERKAIEAQTFVNLAGDAMGSMALGDFGRSRALTSVPRPFARGRTLPDLTKRSAAKKYISVDA